MSLKNDILDFKKAADDYLKPKRTKWDEYESIMSCALSDQVSGTTKSQVFDPQLPTMVIERSNRVMAQLPTGKVQWVSKNDEAAAKLMSLTLDKYVFPNAKAQYDFLIKCRLVDMYSGVYGNFFTFIDWDVKANGYVGPDMWLLNMRDIYPQVGAMSVDDSDKILIRTWQPLSYFESLKKKDGYKSIDKIIAQLKDKSGDKESRDGDEATVREGNQFNSPVAAKKAGYYQVFSLYERDRWVDFVPSLKEDDGQILRDIANPHDNGELPVVCKYSLPLMDDFFGQGKFEMGKTMQYAKNSLWNMYLDAVKMSIFPPVLINKTNIASQSSVKLGPATKWIGRNDINNMAKFLEVSPQGTNTFNNVYQVISAALMNQNGTSDTATTASTDPNFGRTPQALRMQEARENTGDNADRFYMEQFLKQVCNRMVNLVAKKQTGEMRIRLFKDELDELVSGYPEFEEMYDAESGNIIIPKGKFSGVEFDYEMVSGSTYQADQGKQQNDLQSLLELCTQNLQMNPQTGEVTSPILARLKQEMVDIRLGELFKRITANSGTQDWDKIIVDMNKNGGAEVENLLQAQANQFAGAIAAMQGDVGSMPPMEQGGMPMGEAMPPQPAMPMQMMNGQQQPGY